MSDQLAELRGELYRELTLRKRFYGANSADDDSHTRTWNAAIDAARAVLSRPQELADPAEPTKLWLWKNFVNGRPEYWAFDNPFPVHLDHGDPQTLGEPCGYAIFKPSRVGRTDVSEVEVLRRIKESK